MEIQNFRHSFVVYAIKCNVTLKTYIGSTSNLTNRLGNHISSFKSGKSTCYSKHVLENDNYTISVLKDNIDSKQEAKESEHHFISAYGDQCINNNKPILIDTKEYQRNYQKEYNKRKKSSE